MILHILKKDLRLLWPLVLILAVLHGVEAAAMYRLGFFLEPRSLVLFVGMLPMVSVLGMAALTVLVVQQDPLPDGPQDWLVRPIRRRDLLLAKLLFALLFVQGPLWLADTLLGMAAGFAPLSAAAAGAIRGADLCLITLPALCIAAVTRTLVEALVVALGALVLFLAGWGGLMIMGVRPQLGGGGALVWLLLAAWQLLAVLAAVLALRLQYFGRHTAAARRLVAALGLLAFTGPLLFASPTGFGLQSALAAEPTVVTDPVRLGFDSGRPRFHSDRPPVEGQNPGGNVGLSRVPAAVYLPLRVDGMPADALMRSIRTELRIRDDAAGGAEVYRGPPNLSVDGMGSIIDTLLVVRAASAGGAASSTYQAIYLPASVYRRIKDHPVTLEIHWYLALLRHSSPVDLPAVDADQPLAGFGRCGSRIDDDGDGVLVGCQSLDSRESSCFSAYLEQPDAGIRNPSITRCDPDYSPWPDNLWPTVLGNVGVELPFRDLNGLAHYPVDATGLAVARIAFQIWRPRAYFERTLTIPGVRLSDWEPMP